MWMAGSTFASFRESEVMIKIDNGLKPVDLKPQIDRLWELSAPKIWSIARDDTRGRHAGLHPSRASTPLALDRMDQGFVYGSRFFNSMPPATRPS